MKHTVLSIITEIDPAKKLDLEQMLGHIKGDLSNNSLIQFPQISLLHFAGFVISDKKTPSLLIFENNFDGDVAPYFEQLLTISGPGLHQIYQCCTAYKFVTFEREGLKQFLMANMVKPNAYHIGNVGRSANVIKANYKLREQLQGFLDMHFQMAETNEISASLLRKQMQEYVKKNLPSSLYCQLPPDQTFLEKFLPRFRQFLFLGIFVALFIWRFEIALLSFIIFFLIILVILRFKEENDPVFVPSDMPDINELVETETSIQNHLASITDIKSGTFRLILLKVVLFVANLLARTSTKGKLSGIPSIHFAHWSVINNNTQLLFLSNYDGSWSSYLDDFIDKAAKGLTGIWSNTQRFPHTSFLAWDGARDEIAFKGFARTYQVPSLVWYSAYHDLTVQIINKDSKIRENLFNTLTETEIKEWLKLF